jgi:hypothetical protein
MKRMLWMGLLMVFALPLAAFADNVDFTATGGTLSGSNSGLSLSGSVLSVVDGLGGLGKVTGSLGSVSFSTGALISGSLDCMSAGVCAKFAGGGSFDIVGNGTDGIPNGTIFKGMFNGPVTLSLISLGHGLEEFQLSGQITGTMNGVTAVGGIVAITLNTSQCFGSGVTLASADVSISTVTPEPGTLLLMGTGLVGLAGTLRRRIRG